MTRERDSQRSKVYAAEIAALGAWYEQKPDFETVGECKAFAEAIVKRKRVQSRYPKAWVVKTGHVHVKPGFGARRGIAQNGATMVLPRPARQRLVIVHELAHLLTWSTGAPHGWEFCECYLFLVRQVLGAEQEKALREAFQAGRVKYKAPRAKRVLTDEQRAVLVERLEVARAAKALC